nr:transposase [Pseudonocardia sp. ICBG1142]
MLNGTHTSGEDGFNAISRPSSSAPIPPDQHKQVGKGSLLVGKLSASGRQNALAAALKEYGALRRTIYAARYLADPAYRRKISRQLNKGESLHALKRDLFYAHEGMEPFPTCFRWSGGVGAEELGRDIALNPSSPLVWVPFSTSVRR